MTGGPGGTCSRLCGYNGMTKSERLVLLPAIIATFLQLPAYWQPEGLLTQC